MKSQRRMSTEGGLPKAVSGEKKYFMSKYFLHIICILFIQSGYSQNLSDTLTVKYLRLFKDYAGRPAWSPDNQFIACHAKGKDGYYDIYVFNSDGENEKCLSCNHLQLPNKHIGQPSWHPSGDWIVFQAEKKKHILPKIGVLAVPGIGFHSDIYIMPSDGKKVFQLTDLKTKKFVGHKTPSCAILHPHFSNNGKMLSWSERVADGGNWGKWAIKLADFTIENDTPKISNIQTFTPGVNNGYYESNNFMPDDSLLLICGNLETWQSEVGIDIYFFNLKTGSITRLTYSLDHFDECPHPSKSGNLICYLSTEGFPNQNGKSWWNWAKGEFWIMRIDGTGKQQITHFNTPKYAGYTGNRTIPAYISWNNEGKKILLGVAVEYKKKRLKDQIWILEFE